MEAQQKKNMEPVFVIVTFFYSWHYHSHGVIFTNYDVVIFSIRASAINQFKI